MTERLTIREGMTERCRFNVGGAHMFRLAWRQYHQDKTWATEAWQRHQETILHSWRCFMQAVLAPVTWQALQLYLERWADLRLTWTKPGGYFFTRTGNRRKRIREQLRPCHTVTVIDKLEAARMLSLEALEAEGYKQPHWWIDSTHHQQWIKNREDCRDDLQIITLVLCGTIYSGRGLKKCAVKMKSRPARFIFPEAHPWPWPRSVAQRLRRLRRQGLLTQPDWREVRL